MVQITHYTGPNYTDHPQVNIHCIENFHRLWFLSNLHPHWKTEFALKFLTVLNIFLPFRIFEQLALALKNRVSLKFFTLLKYFLSFRIFEQLALALKIFKPGGGVQAPGLVRLCPELLLWQSVSFIVTAREDFKFACGSNSLCFIKSLRDELPALHTKFYFLLLLETADLGLDYTFK